MIPTPSTRLRTATEIVREAARAIRAAHSPKIVRFKASAVDIQTATDVRVESLVRRRLRQQFPDDTIIGEEESGTMRPDLTRPTWFIDPVDGTANFFRGLPLFASNLAYWNGERLECAVVADVAHRRLYTARHGHGAFRGRTRVRVSATPTLTEALVSTGVPQARFGAAAGSPLGILGQVRDMRRIGAAGLDTAFVASGWLDAYWERDDGPWDWAPGALLVSEAGGAVTTWTGEEWRPGADTLVASNGVLHARILDALRAEPARQA